MNIGIVPPTTSVLFLGVADRAAYVREGETNLYKWNILGLKNVVLTNILPFSLSGLHFGIAVSAETMITQNKLKLRIVHESGAEAGTIGLQPLQLPAPSFDPMVDFQGLFLQVTTHSIVVFVGLPNTPPILAMWPGKYEIRQMEGQDEIIVGQFHIAVVDPVPLSTERIAAIRSDPTASKAVRIELACQFCDTKCRAYASLEKNTGFESAGWTWYADLPDSFVCA